jgi:1-acyl-sn-glycerol-3-phosphate acyltransferase
VRTPLTFIYNPLLELGYCLVRIFARVFWRVKIINPERLAPQNAILVANHQSSLDPIWLFSFVPARYRRDVYIAIKKEYSYLKYLLPGFNFIFVDREGNNFIPILKAEADILRQGKSLIVFPEGTRTTTVKGGPFRTGAAFLAKNLNKQLLPLTINGSFNIWPRTKAWPKLFSMKPSTITVHETIAPDKFATIEDLNTALAKVVTTDNLK